MESNESIDIFTEIDEANGLNDRQKLFCAEYVKRKFNGKAAAIAAEKYLYENGILASAIRPPTVPNGTARLRISVSASHAKEELEKLANLLKKIL